MSFQPTEDRYCHRGESFRTDSSTTVVAVLLLCAAVLSLGCEYLPGGSEPAPEALHAAATPAAPSAVSCLGHIEPKDKIYRISAPYFEGRPALVKNLQVEQGQWVDEGQILAILYNRNTFEARVREAEARVPVMEAKLKKAKEGPKEGDIAAQKEEIARWESMLRIARADFERYNKLRESEDVSASMLDEKRRTVENAEKMLAQARERLSSLIEIRPSDVQLAELELQSALATVSRTRADLDMTIVKSPMRAQVLQINAREGEEVGPAGLLELGRTDEMYVVAEVYETDIGKVRAGDRATISGEILASDLEGTVDRIGQQVQKNEALPLDPAQYADARIVKVHIRLDDSEPVAGLINGRVSVQFHP